MTNNSANSTNKASCEKMSSPDDASCDGDHETTASTNEEINGECVTGQKDQLDSLDSGWIVEVDRMGKKDTKSMVAPPT